MHPGCNSSSGACPTVSTFIPACFQAISRVSAAADIRKRNKTGAKLDIRAITTGIDLQYFALVLSERLWQLEA